MRGTAESGVWPRLALMIILGFRLLNMHKFKQNHTFIVCRISADFYGNGNNDHYKYNLMTCFIDICRL